MTSIDAVRTLALSLPRTTEVLVRDRVKLRVGRIVYLAFSRDETQNGARLPQGTLVYLGRVPEELVMQLWASLRTLAVPAEVRPAAVGVRAECRRARCGG